jgi:hypothetical protein
LLLNIHNNDFVDHLSGCGGEIASAHLGHRQGYAIPVKLDPCAFGNAFTQISIRFAVVDVKIA